MGFGCWIGFGVDLWLGFLEMKTAEFILRSPEIKRNAIKHLIDLDSDKEWLVTIAPHKKKRTLNQNSLLHEWIMLMAYHTGDSMASMKRDLKAEFSPLVESKITPGKFSPKDTSEMDTAEMSEFMDKVSALAASWGVRLPVPQDQTSVKSVGEENGS